MKKVYRKDKGQGASCRQQWTAGVRKGFRRQCYKNGGVRKHPCPHDTENLPREDQLRMFLYQFVVCHRWFNLNKLPFFLFFSALKN